MRYSSVAVSVLAVLLAACNAGENPSSARSAANEVAVNDVAARMDGYVGAAKAGDAMSLADFVASDAIIWEPEFKANPAEFKKFIGDFLKTSSIGDLQVTATERVAYDSATVVYEFGHYTETIKPNDGKSPTVTEKGNYAIRWVKGGDAKWRFHRFMVVNSPADSVQIAPAVAAIPPADGPALDAATVTVQVTQAMTDAMAKTNAGDEAGLLKAWAEDFQVYEPELQFMSRAAITPAIHELFATNTVNIALHTEQVFVHDNGHVAYQLGEYQETLTPKDGKSKPVVFHNTFMARWKRGADGGWLWDRMIVTPLPKDTAH